MTSYAEVAGLCTSRCRSEEFIRDVLVLEGRMGGAEGLHVLST